MGPVHCIAGVLPRFVPPDRRCRNCSRRSLAILRIQRHDRSLNPYKIIGARCLLGGMKRKLIIAGIFLGLALAAVVVVLATRQDNIGAGVGPTVEYTPQGQLVIAPQRTYAQMTVVAPLLKTNVAPVRPVP